MMDEGTFLKVISGEFVRVATGHGVCQEPTHFLTVDSNLLEHKLRELTLLEREL